MTNEEKAVGIGLHVRDFSISKEKTKTMELKKVKLEDFTMKCCNFCNHIAYDLDKGFMCTRNGIKNAIVLGSSKCCVFEIVCENYELVQGDFRY